MSSADREGDFARARMHMIALIRSRGIENDALLEAMDKVPRHKFVPSHLSDLAYEDGPLPIGEGQTISQPYIVALMIEAAGVKSGDHVLEVGAGSGYSTAVLAAMGAEVFTIERNAAMAEAARERLRRLGFGAATVVTGDGTVGLEREAPFDAIIVTAGGPSVPPKLSRQLRDGGALVIPVGPMGRQVLMRVRRTPQGTLSEERLGDAVFVPLIGEQGWPE